MGVWLSTALALATSLTAPDEPSEQAPERVERIRVAVPGGDRTAMVLVRGMEITPWFEPVRCRFGHDPQCPVGYWCREESTPVSYGVRVMLFESQWHISLYAIGDEEPLVVITRPADEGRKAANMMLNAMVDLLVP